MKNNQTITISLPIEQIEKVKVYSKETGRTFSGFISYSIEKVMELENAE